MIIYPSQLTGPDLIKWLESPDGEEWSRRRHGHQVYANDLVTIKEDRYCCAPRSLSNMDEPGDSSHVKRVRIFTRNGVS